MYILILGSSRFEDVSTYRRLISNRKSSSWNDLVPWSHLRYWLACTNPPRQRSRQRVYPLSCTGPTDAGEMTGLTRVRYTVGSIGFRVSFDFHHMQSWLHELCGMSYDQACVRDGLVRTLPALLRMLRTCRRPLLGPVPVPLKLYACVRRKER